MQFDPANNDADFLELEKIAREEFEKYRTNISNGISDNTDIIVERKGSAGKRREIWLIGEMDPLTAVSNPQIEAAGLELGFRELFSKMLSWYDKVDFPLLREIVDGRNVDFKTAWAECMEFVNDPQSWFEMSAEVSKENFSTSYYTWMCVAVDPKKPYNRRIDFTSSYSVKSPFLLDSEDRGAKMRSFSEWLREILKN